VRAPGGLAQPRRGADGHPDAAHGRRRGDAALADLSERELDVFGLLESGRSNAEIADTLVLGEATVKTHVGSVLSKLGLRDRIQAVVLAYESGFLQPGR
jgi:DNA-binding NarL/FixJ family response regulator